MRRCRYKYKFATVALCVLLPLGAMAFALQGLLSQRIQQIRVEMVGQTWIRNVNAADLELSGLALSDPAWLDTGRSVRDRLLSGLAREPWDGGTDLIMSPELIQALEGAPGKCPLAGDDLARNDLPGMSCIEGLRDWVYDNSGLVLDSSMESFYLGHVLAVTGPALNAGLRSLSVALRSDPQRREQRALQVLDEVQQRLLAVRREALRAAPTHQGLSAAMEALTGIEGQVRLWQSMVLAGRVFPVDTLNEEMKQVSLSLQAFWDGVDQALTVDLAQQLTQGRRMRGAVIGGLLFAALSMFYLFSAFYLATLRDIGQLDRATHVLLREPEDRLSHDSVRRLRLPSRDELSAVSDAFQAFASRVVADNQRLRQLEDHLRQEKVSLEAALENLGKAQASLVQSEKLASLGGLVAGIAHEVNTPLGVAVTSASHLMDEADSVSARLATGALRKTDLSDFMQSHQMLGALITRNLARASELIKSFKTMSVDQSSEARRSFELGAYLHEVLRSLHSLHARRPIEVVLDGRVTFQMDSYPGAVAQVMTNLLSNALAHAFEADVPGRIDIELEQVAAERVRLRVRDNGRGIAAEDLPRVFDPFFTTARGRGGSGLGLSIVHTLVAQKLGGSIELSSEPGHGTCFEIVLPSHPSHRHAEVRPTEFDTPITT